MPVSTGDYILGAHLISEKKFTSTGAAVIAKGDVLTVQSNKWATAATTGNKGPYRVAAQSQVTADLTVNAICDGFVYVTADGTINPGDLVTPNGVTTAGRVVSYTATTIATTPANADVTAARDEYRAALGVYIGHENEGGANSPPTAAAQGEVVRIQLRGAL